MNVSELFFFKTFPCTNIKKHQTSGCYYYHNTDDHRRKILLFENYLSIYENADLPKDNLLGFNTSENKLGYYKEVMSFDNDNIKIDKMFFGGITFCANKVEYAYHLHNYKKDKCPYEEMKVQCPFGKLCYNEHRSDIEEMVQSMSILKSFIASITSQGIFIFLRDIVRAYRAILQEANSFLPESVYSSLNNQLDHFKTFFTDELSYDKIKIEEEEISQAIVEELNAQAKIKIGSNFYEQFDINNRLVFASSTFPKQNEIIMAVIAMLNSQDGYIIYGVQVNTEKINGISLSRKDRDKFRCWFNSAFESILIEFEENVKYNFYDSKQKNVCVLVITVKQIKKEKLVSDSYGNSYIIKDKFLQKFDNKSSTTLDINDIKALNQKEYIEVLRLRLIDHYTKKCQI